MNPNSNHVTKNKYINRLYIGGTMGILTLMLIMLLITPKKSFSYFENRYLQSTLQFSWQSVIDKSFGADAERFIADQFPWREQWFTLKGASEQARLMAFNNGIYLGKHHFLFEPMQEANWGEVEQYVDSINQLINKFPSIHSTLFLAPTSVELYQHLLPNFSSTYPQYQALEQISTQLDGKVNLVDGIEALQTHSNDAQQLYYRNDHHWTSYGAYWAYVAYMKQLGITPMTLEQFRAVTVSDDFRGSFHTKGQFIGTTPDTIIRYDSDFIHSNVHIADDNSTMDGLYDESRLSQKDQYNYFLGGVHALLTINNELTDQGKAAGHQFDIDTILVIKDSYAHAFLPFLSQHAKKIVVVDPRYYNGSIEQLIEQNQPQQLLLMYNIPTFINERSLLKLKR